MLHPLVYTHQSIRLDDDDDGSEGTGSDSD